MTKIKIRQIRAVPCPKHKRAVPVKHYQSGVSLTELACISCPEYGGATCNYIKCNYNPGAP